MWGGVKGEVIDPDGSTRSQNLKEKITQKPLSGQQSTSVVFHMLSHQTYHHEALTERTVFLF